VEAALGAKVAAGKETSAEARSLCSFALASAGDQAVIVAATSSSGVPAAFTEARGKAESPQPLTAGDEAFITPGQAVVRKGTTMVAILLAVRQPAAQLTSAATKLVQAVSSHL
jgi:hypothetical protein